MGLIIMNNIYGRINLPLQGEQEKISDIAQGVTVGLN